jgi:hypothetical protein
MWRKIETFRNHGFSPKKLMLPRLKRSDFVPLNLIQGAGYLGIDSIINAMQHEIPAPGGFLIYHGRDILWPMAAYCLLSAIMNAFGKAKPRTNESCTAKIIFFACLMYEFIQNLASYASLGFLGPMLNAINGAPTPFDLRDVGCYALGTVAAVIASYSAAIMTKELKLLAWLIKRHYYSRKYIW